MKVGLRLRLRLRIRLWLWRRLSRRLRLRHSLALALAQGWGEGSGRIAPTFCSKAGAKSGSTSTEVLIAGIITRPAWLTSTAAKSSHEHASKAMVRSEIGDKDPEPSEDLQ